MSQQEQRKRPRPTNIPSTLLNDAENQKLFSILGSRCVTLASAVVQVLLADLPPNNLWNKKCCGVACLIKDNQRRSYYIRVYDLKTKSCVWEQELHNQFNYNSTRPRFHTFEADNCPAGLNFANENEANQFKRAVDDKLLQRQKRKMEKKAIAAAREGRLFDPVGQDRYMTSVVSQVPNVSFNQIDSGRNIIKKTNDPKFRAKRGTGQLLTKADIGTPIDFKKLSHPCQEIDVNQNKQKHSHHFLPHGIPAPKPNRSRLGAPPDVPVGDMAPPRPPKESRSLLSSPKEGRTPGPPAFGGIVPQPPPMEGIPPPALPEDVKPQVYVRMGNMAPPSPPMGAMAPLHPLMAGMTPPPPIGKVAPSSPPMGDIRPLSSPMGVMAPPSPPIRDMTSHFPPMGDIAPHSPPKIDMTPCSPPMGEMRPLSPPMRNIAPPSHPMGDMAPPSPPIRDMAPCFPPIGNMVPPPSQVPSTGLKTNETNNWGTLMDQIINAKPSQLNKVDFTKREQSKSSNTVTGESIWSAFDKAIKQRAEYFQDSDSMESDDDFDSDESGSAF